MDSKDLADALIAEDPIQFMQLQLSKDKRKNVSGDLAQKYKNYEEYRNSQLARDIDRAYNLLPESDEITVADLTNGLSKYGYDSSYQERIIKELGSNDVRVKARRNSYSHSINNDDVKISRRLD